MHFLHIQSSLSSSQVQYWNCVQQFPQFDNQNFNGINDIDAYPMLEDECGEEYALPPFDIEFTTENFSRIDDVLNFTSS